MWLTWHCLPFWRSTSESSTKHLPLCLPCSLALQDSREGGFASQFSFLVRAVLLRVSGRLAVVRTTISLPPCVFLATDRSNLSPHFSAPSYPVVYFSSWDLPLPECSPSISLCAYSLTFSSWASWEQAAGLCCPSVYLECLAFKYYWKTRKNCGVNELNIYKASLLSNHFPQMSEFSLISRVCGDPFPCSLSEPRF